MANFSNTWLKFQVGRSKIFGFCDELGISWECAYEDHLRAVDHPMPFGKFMLKMNILNRMLNADPEGKVREFNKRIADLSNELGV